MERSGTRVTERRGLGPSTGRVVGSSPSLLPFDVDAAVRAFGGRLLTSAVRDGAAGVVRAETTLGTLALRDCTFDDAVDPARSDAAWVHAARLYRLEVALGEAGVPLPLPLPTARGGFAAGVPSFQAPMAVVRAHRWVEPVVDPISVAEVQELAVALGAALATTHSLPGWLADMAGSSRRPGGVAHGSPSWRNVRCAANGPVLVGWEAARRSRTSPSWEVQAFAADCPAAGVLGREELLAAVRASYEEHLPFARQRLRSFDVARSPSVDAAVATMQDATARAERARSGPVASPVDR